MSTKTVKGFIIRPASDYNPIINSIEMIEML